MHQHNAIQTFEDGEIVMEMTAIGTDYQKYAQTRDTVRIAQNTRNGPEQSSGRSAVPRRSNVLHEQYLLNTVFSMGNVLPREKNIEYGIRTTDLPVARTTSWTQTKEDKLQIGSGCTDKGAKLNTPLLEDSAD